MSNEYTNVVCNGNIVNLVITQELAIIPDGYDYLDYRVPKIGELYIAEFMCNQKPIKCSVNSNRKKVIVVKSKVTIDSLNCGDRFLYNGKKFLVINCGSMTNFRNVLSLDSYDIKMLRNDELVERTE